MPLTLSVADGEWPSGEVTVVRRIDVPATDATLWETSVDVSAKIVDSEKIPRLSQPAFMMQPAGRPFAVHVPVDVSLADFDLVRIEFATQGFVRVAAAIRLGTKQHGQSDFLERFEVLDPIELDFDLGALAGDEDELDRISFVFEALTHQGAIVGVELIRRPISVQLPSPNDPPQHVAIGTGSREATGLLPGVVLESIVPAPQTGSVAVEASAPARKSDGARADLELAIWSGEEVLREKTFEVSTGWRTLELAIPERTGSPDEPLRLRVTTSTESGVYVGTARRLAKPGTPTPSGAPRTVVLITSDTHRADHMGFAPGGVGVRTPTLDALAERGVRYHKATAATSITNPSHASIFTGLSVKDTGIVGNIVLLADRANTIAEEYRDAGFRTFAAVSARHLIPWRSGFGQGFERFDAPIDQMTRDGKETVDAAVDMLSDADGHDVFLWLHLFDAHAPYVFHEDCTQRYYEGDPYSEKLAEIAPEAKAGWDQKIRDARYVLALYKGEVNYVDDLLADFFERAPRTEDGWVAFTADHGESLGEHNLFWTHVGLYPNTLNVPLIVAGPGVPTGVASDARVTNVDVARTLLEASGVVEPDPLDESSGFPGRTLLSDDVLTGEIDEPRFAVGPNGLSAGIFSGDWYLILHLRKKFWGNPPGAPAHTFELYDLSTDPDCSDNIVMANLDRAKRLRQALVTWLVQRPEGGALTGSAPNSVAARADIAALGYAVDETSSIDEPLIDPDCNCSYCQASR